MDKFKGDSVRRLDTSANIKAAVAKAAESVLRELQKKHQLSDDEIMDAIEFINEDIIKKGSRIGIENTHVLEAVAVDAIAEFLEKGVGLSSEGTHIFVDTFKRKLKDKMITG